MSKTLKEVLGSTYDYFFPAEKALQEAIEAEPPTLRTPPSAPCKDRAVKVKVINADDLDRNVGPFDALNDPHFMLG